MDVEEFTDLYVENSFHVRWTEIEFYHDLGMALLEVQDLKPYAKSIKKHESFLKTCVEFYKKYPNLNETPFGKDISWSRIRKEFETEKRPRVSIREKLHARMEIYSELCTLPGDYYRGKYDEDKELLQELKEGWINAKNYLRTGKENNGRWIW